MAVISAAGFTYALCTRAHMRITLAFPISRLAVQRAERGGAGRLGGHGGVLRRALRRVNASIGAHKGGWTDPMVWRRASTPMQTPLWMPQALFLGLALFAATATACAAHASACLKSRAAQQPLRAADPR